MDYLLSNNYRLSQEILSLINNKVAPSLIVSKYFSNHSKKCNQLTLKLIKMYLKDKLKSYCLSEHLYKSKYKCGCNP